MLVLTNESRLDVKQVHEHYLKRKRIILQSSVRLFSLFLDRKQCNFFFFTAVLMHSVVTNLDQITM